ncbi:MAG: ribonuclease P protein component [Patescibacteria group bacterium]
MLSSSKRLSTNLFKETLEKGLVYNTQFTLLYILNGFRTNRFSVSIPKKVAKLAVLRNKIRRRIYSIIESLSSRTIPSVHVAVIMKGGSEKMSFKSLREEIQKAFVKSGILK